MHVKSIVMQWNYILLVVHYSVLIMFNIHLWPFLFLVGRFSIYLLAFICTKREYCLCIQLLRPKVVPNESTIPTYMRDFHAVPSKFVCANSNFQNKFHFCVTILLMKRQGVVNIFHVWYLILMMSVYSLVIPQESGW